MVEDGRQVYAWETDKEQSPFTCPACQGKVVLKQGDIKIHHFAHAPGHACEYGGGETVEHLETKRAIFEALRDNSDVSRLQLERNLKTVIPDISCYIGDTRVAIEVQRSNINIETIERRLTEYTRLNIAVMWVLLDRPSHYPTLRRRWTRDDCVPLAVWKQYLLDLYGGRLCFHLNGRYVSQFSLWNWSKGRYVLQKTYGARWLGDFDIVKNGWAQRYFGDDAYPGFYLWKVSGNPQIEF